MGAEYQEAKERCLATKHILWPRRLSMTEQVRYGLLSASDKALIEICERGTPREFLEGLLLPRLEKKYPDLEALKKGGPPAVQSLFSPKAQAQDQGIRGVAKRLSKPLAQDRCAEPRADEALWQGSQVPERSMPAIPDLGCRDGGEGPGRKKCKDCGLQAARMDRAGAGAYSGVCAHPLGDSKEQ